MTTTEWRGLYRRALIRAQCRAQSIAETTEPELIACGFTTNVDKVADLNADVLAKLVAGLEIDLDCPRVTTVERPLDLVTAIVQCVALGEGTDLPVSNPETQDWLLERVEGRSQLGGTGAQTANTLAVLGFPTLLHHTGLSPAQAETFTRPEFVLIPDGNEMHPVSGAANEHDETMWHVALEYRAGLTVEVGGRRITAPNPSRIIVSYDPVNAAFSLDCGYVNALAMAPRPVRRVLIAGYSQITSPEALRRLVVDTREAIRLWRLTRPNLFVHVELGAMPQPETLAGVVDSLGREVDSIGLNVDELRDLLRAWGDTPSGDPSGLVAELGNFRRLYSTPRIGLHSMDWCLTLTTRDPATEREALLFGALVASTRARIGDFPTFSDLETTLARSALHPNGERSVEALQLEDGIGRHGNDWLVAVPAIAVPHPAATVGLGDSFTAGLLAMM